MTWYIIKTLLLLKLPLLINSLILRDELISNKVKLIILK